MEFWKNFEFQIPSGDCSQASLRRFKQLSFLERLYPSHLSKVMVIGSFFALNF